MFDRRLAVVALALACVDSETSKPLDTTTPLTSTTGEVPGSGGTGGGTGTGTGTGGPTTLPTATTGTSVDGLYPQDHVVQIAVEPPPGEWQALLDVWDAREDKEWFATAVTIDGVVRSPVGYRLKGWSSIQYGTGFGGGVPGRDSDPRGKFPLTIDFDREGGTHFDGHDRISLNNNWADLSYMRTRLASRLYNQMGVPSSATTYARSTVDGHDSGLYTLVQPIDKPFLKATYGTEADADDGNLYKIVYSGTTIGGLVWQGDSRDDYIDTRSCTGGNDECGLLLKTNEDDPTLNDYADVITFLDVLNHAPDETFADDLEAVFEVDTFLRLAAVNVALSSFDNYFGLQHNYYLYHRPDTDRFVMLPWDLNEAYAGHPCGDSMIDHDIREPVCDQRGQPFVLADRVFAVPEFEAQYLAYLEEIATDWLTEAVHGEWIDELDALIHDEIATDPNYIADLADYERSLTDAPPSGINLGGHGGTEYNLLDFVIRRRQAILDQL
ncbi:MAG: spore coat protein CotH [Myxococcota bacterium]|jgi:spore coat protein CotH